MNRINRFEEKEKKSSEIKAFADERNLTSVKKEKEEKKIDFSSIKKKEKYKLLLYLDTSLEKPLKKLAEESGLSLTKCIEVLIRKAIKKGEL